MPWPRARRSGLLVLPVGATEQHGPHLPVGTDTAIAAALAERLGAARPDVVVAPGLAYGSSGEHAGFAGTLSIGQAATELVLTELVRSADAFAGVVVVSTHGGNAGPVRRAVRTLDAEGRRVLAWHPRRPPGECRWDLHAGWAETSLMLALDPAAVDMGAARPGNVRPWTELAGQVEANGVAPVSANGVLGDPTGATAGAGERLLAALADDLAAAVASVWPAPTGQGRL